MRAAALILALGALAAAGAALAQPPAPPQPEKRLVVTSPAFADGGVIPDKYTLAVQAPVSLPVEWINSPAGAASFAIIMHDPDSVTGKGSADIVHWMVFNIPADAHGLPENLAKQAALPGGVVQVQIRPGAYGYSGPGARFVYHHYTVELFALDTKLDLPAETTREQLMAAMNGHVVAKSAYVGRFHR